MKKIKDAYGLEEGKFYIIKVRRGSVKDRDLSLLNKQLLKNKVKAIICLVKDKDDIVISEKNN